MLECLSSFRLPVLFGSLTRSFLLSHTTTAPPPPPGFEDVAPGTHAWAEDEKKDSDAAAPDGADAVADKLAGAAVEGDCLPFVRNPPRCVVE